MQLSKETEGKIMDAIMHCNICTDYKFCQVILLISSVDKICICN